MNVLVACECSGRVKTAFRKRGHNAWSCDLKPSEIPDDKFHIQDDVLKHLDDGWDLMIAHPPCTYISYVGTRHWNQEGRVYKRLQALRFFADLWTADIYRICLENPKSCASPVIAKYSQEIQPYYFGDNDVKAAWLWLKNLPKLEYSKVGDMFKLGKMVDKPMPLAVTPSGKNLYFEECVKGKDKSAIRSITFPSIAEAMAEQWGSLPTL